MSKPVLQLGAAAAACSFLMAAPAAGQGRGLDLSYGRWWHEGGGPAQIFTATLKRPLFGPIGYGVGITYLDDRRSLTDRTQTGGELSLTLGATRGPYAVAAGGLGLRHADGKVDAQWSAGGGYAITALSVVRLALDARYRVEDERVRGFWQLNPADRRGLYLQAGISLRLGAGRSASRPTTTSRAPARNPPAPRAPPPRPEEPPSVPEMAALARHRGADADVAALAAAVVETALDAMGTPYEWGGSDENGFDCSGLIQYAYSEHRIILPRVARDQIRQGRYVDPIVTQLQPGDILGFNVNGNGVSHVGLYVGDGEFIHSSSQGVRLSSLTAGDGDSRWWQARWASARRILN